MHIGQVTKEHIEEFGSPDIHPIQFGTTKLGIVNFPATATRARMARDFAIAGVLRTDAAIKMYNAERAQHKSEHNIPINVWEEIGRMENLPEFEALPPDVRRRTKSAVDSADFPNLCFDQVTFDSTIIGLIRMQDTDVRSKQPNAYTLYEGSPGTAKSKVSRVLGAVIPRPIYAFNAERTSPDVLKSQLLGNDELVGMPWAAAQKLVDLGGLKQPAARRELIELTRDRTIEELTQEDFDRLARLEGLENGSVYTVPGLVPLAQKYGGLLILEELNATNSAGFNFLITNALDVYNETHPNYHVVANMNPAGPNSPNREALPIELLSRFGQAHTVRQLTTQEVADMLRFQMTGAQPTIKYRGESFIANANMFGVENVAQPRLMELSKLLTPGAIVELSTNLARLHTAIEEQIKGNSKNAGLLNRADSQVPDTFERTSWSRRELMLCVRGIINNIMSEALPLPEKRQKLTAPASIDLTKLMPEKVAEAIARGVESYYLEPLRFEVDKQRILSVTDPKGVSTQLPDATESTEVLLRHMFREYKMDVAGLKGYIQTPRGTDVVQKRVNEFTKDKYPNAEAATKILGSVLDAVHKKDLSEAVMYSSKNVLLPLGPEFLDTKALFPSIEAHTVADSLEHLVTLKKELAAFEKKLTLAGVKVPSYKAVLGDKLNAVMKKNYDPTQINIIPLRGAPNTDEDKIFFTIQFPVTGEDKKVTTKTAIYNPYSAVFAGKPDISSISASEKFTVRSCVETADDVDTSVPLKINIHVFGEIDMSKAMQAPKKSQSRSMD